MIFNDRTRSVPGSVVPSVFAWLTNDVNFGLPAQKFCNSRLTWKRAPAQKIARRIARRFVA
jgi:hypothetical protein